MRIALLCIIALTLGVQQSQAQDVPLLVSDLQSADESTATAAGEQLMLLLGTQYGEIAAELTPLIAHADEEIRYYALAFMLTGAVGSASNAQIAMTYASEITTATGDTSQRVRLSAIRLLMSEAAGPPPSSIPTLLPLLSDGDPDVAAAAANALTRVQPTTPEIVTGLQNTLSTASDSTTKSGMLRGLARVAPTDPTSVSAFATLLDDDEATIRQQAIYSLMSSGEASVGHLAKLQELAESDEDPSVRFAAGELVSLIAGSYDFDLDGTSNSMDNCLHQKNGPVGDGVCEVQVDTNQDGYGNVCDTDFNNDGATGLDGLAALQARLFDASADEYDLNCDGVPALDDLNDVLLNLGATPGPSGLTCAGTIPCP